MRDSTRYERIEEIRGFKYIRLKPGRRQKEGRLVSYFDMREAADRAESDLVRAVSRCLKLAASDYDLEALAWFVGRVHDYIHAVEAEIEKRQGMKTQEERIALLRNTTGRTPEEAAAYRRKADELERKLDRCPLFN